MTSRKSQGGNGPSDGQVAGASLAETADVLVRLALPGRKPALIALSFVLLCLLPLPVLAQAQAGERFRITLIVTDENNVAVPAARVIVSQPDLPPLHLVTNYAGICQYSLAGKAPYNIEAGKAGYYESEFDAVDPTLTSVELTLTHQRIVREQISVAASPPGINPGRTAGTSTMNTPEIVNIPYLTSRDIRNVLPFNPGIVQDATGQVHVSGSDTFATLDLLDGFDIRSPASGGLNLRVSTDAVRSILVEDTRYPVEFGKATGGVIAFTTGMGDNQPTFNATDFLPSFRDIHGIRLDKFAPRITFSGPFRRDRAWYFNAFDMEYDHVYIRELPEDANTNHIWRESNLGKFQVNLPMRNTLIGGLLLNNYHSPYDGISSLVPRQSTTRRNTISWMPYLDLRHMFPGGALLHAGIALLRIHDGYIPQGDVPFEITPELTQGSYFENLTGRSHRVQEKAVLYLPARHSIGTHELKLGVDFDQIGVAQELFRAPVSYLREDGTLLRRSTFPSQPPFHRGNFEAGAYLEDHWVAPAGFVIDPGIRFDWDEIVRRPLVSPRIAVTYAPGTRTGGAASTKVSAGIGLYYEYTPLSFIEEALAGDRTDQYYAVDGVTPVGPASGTSFVAEYSSLRQPSVVNWSISLERRLPWSIFAAATYLDKQGRSGMVFANQGTPGALSGTYLLTNSRSFHYRSVDFSLRHTSPRGYTLYGDFMHSVARTNAALDYSPTISVLGAQQPGPLPWDIPNRVISWGWLPVPFIHGWDFVYSVDWHTGVPYTSVNANQQVVGPAGSRRFPNYSSFSPGLEWKFHFRGYYFGLRGVIENATDNSNPAVVNNVVVSPQYGQFTEVEGRSLTARIRLISTK